MVTQSLHLSNEIILSLSTGLCLLVPKRPNETLSVTNKHNISWRANTLEMAQPCNLNLIPNTVYSLSTNTHTEHWSKSKPWVPCSPKKQKPRWNQTQTLKYDFLKRKLSYWMSGKMCTFNGIDKIPTMIWTHTYRYIWNTSKEQKQCILVWRWREKETHIHCCWECQLIQHFFWKTIWALLK